MSSWPTHMKVCIPFTPPAGTGRSIVGAKPTEEFDQEGYAIAEWRQKFMVTPPSDLGANRSSEYQVESKPAPLLIPGCDPNDPDETWRRGNDSKCDMVAAALAFVQAVPPIRADVRGTAIGDVIDEIMFGTELGEEAYAALGEVIGSPESVAENDCIPRLFQKILEAKEHTKKPVPCPVTCPICLDDMDLTGGASYSEYQALPCGHYLHKNCFREILRSNTDRKCPMCRFDLPPKEIETKLRVPPPGIVGITDTEGIIKFSNRDYNTGLTTWTLKKKKSWKTGDIVSVNLKSGDMNTFHQPSTVDTSLSSIIRKKLNEFENRGCRFWTGEEIMATSSTVGCAHCNSPAGFGRVETVDLDFYPDKNVLLEDALSRLVLADRRGQLSCNFCVNQANLNYSDGGSWYFDVSLGAWKVVQAEKNWKGSFVHTTLCGRAGKHHYLTLPRILLIEIKRFDLKMSKDRRYLGDTISYCAVNCPFDLDLGPFLACDPPSDATSKYELRFVLEIEPMTQEGKLAKEKNDAEYEGPMGARYMGSAKGCDNLWYKFDVCNPTRRAPNMDMMKRMTSSTAVLLAYVRKDCL